MPCTHWRRNNGKRGERRVVIRKRSRRIDWHRLIPNQSGPSRVYRVSLAIPFLRSKLSSSPSTLCHRASFNWLKASPKQRLTTRLILPEWSYPPSKQWLSRANCAWSAPRWGNVAFDDAVRLNIWSSRKIFYFFVWFVRWIILVFFWEELLKHWKQRMSVETTKVKTRGIYGYYGLSLNVGNGLSFPWIDGRKKGKVWVCYVF